MSDFGEEDTAFIKRAISVGVPLKVIYDIGASNGTWSALMEKVIQGGEYHLFEPLAEIAQYSEHLNRNLTSLHLAKLHPVALSNLTGRTRISVAQDGFSSSLHDMTGVEGFGAATSVISYRLDDYVSQNGLPLPSLIKMDTQGTEDLILEGARETIKSANSLIIETWLYRGYGPKTPLLSEITSFLEPLGFSIFGFGGEYRDPLGRLAAIDAYFCNGETLKSLSGIR